jgi:hypothetical protein
MAPPQHDVVVIELMSSILGRVGGYAWSWVEAVWQRLFSASSSTRDAGDRLLCNPSIQEQTGKDFGVFS